MTSDCSNEELPHIIETIYKSNEENSVLTSSDLDILDDFRSNKAEHKCENDINENIFLKNLARLNQSVTLVDNEEYSRRTIDFWHDHVYKKNNNTTPFTIENILSGHLSRPVPIIGQFSDLLPEQESLSGEYISCIELNSEHMKIVSNNSENKNNFLNVELSTRIETPTPTHQTVASVSIEERENNTEPLNLIINKKKRNSYTKGIVSLNSLYLYIIRELICIYKVRK